jgi:hypothetical protein
MHMKLKPIPPFATACSLLLVLPFTSHADTSFTINNSTADAFLATGSPGNPVGSNLASLNFGGAGTLAIAPASSAKGQMDSLVKFNVASAVTQFNTTYGVGNWQITSATLTLGSNFGDQGEQPNNNIFNSINAGKFAVDWLANDSWVEGTGGGMGTPGYPGNSMVSFQSIPTLFAGGSESLGTNTYTPPGDGVYVNYGLSLGANFVADVMTGGDISLYFFAADNQVGFLFNSRTFASNHPEITFTAAAIPEPGFLALATLPLAAALIFRNRGKRDAIRS